MQPNNRRLKSETLMSDEAAITAFKTMEGYVPAPGLPTVESLLAMSVHVRECGEAFQEAENEAMVRRNEMIAAENERHEAVLRLKAHVIAQYGRNSNEVRMIGLKRQIDRKRPTRRTTDD